MSLLQNLIPLDKYDIKCPYYMNPKGICIHNTANDASAINERNYMANNNNEVSFHIAVDNIQAIQCIPFNRNAWASGDGGNGEGNRNYIHLEICYSLSGGDRFINAEKRAAKEVALLLKQYGWSISNVKKHQDFSNKYCPHRTLDMGWQRFLNMIQAELNNLNTRSVSDMKKIVTYYGDADVFAAVIVAQKNRCPLMSVADYVASGLKSDEVIQIGGKQEDTNRYASFRNAAKLV